MLRGVPKVFASSVLSQRCGTFTPAFFLNQRFASFVMKVPSMGDSITEGSILNWKKQVGEYVAADEVICEIETDKASGVILSHAAQAGSTVFVSGDLVTIDTDAAAPAGAAAAAPAAAPASTPAPAAAPAAAAPKAASSSHRVPMIKFPRRGAAASTPECQTKCAGAKSCSGASKPAAPGYTPVAPKVEAAPAKSGSTTVERYNSFLDLPASLKGIPFSAAEIDAINGGDYGYTDEWSSTVARKPKPAAAPAKGKDAKKEAPKKK